MILRFKRLNGFSAPPRAVPPTRSSKYQKNLNGFSTKPLEKTMIGAPTPSTVAVPTDLHKVIVGMLAYSLAEVTEFKFLTAREQAIVGDEATFLRLREMAGLSK